MNEEIQFFVPESCIPPFEKFRDWLSPDGSASQENNTLQNWNYQTWYHLQRLGFPCRRVAEVPDEGILLSTWAPELKALWNRPEVFLVGIAADGLAWPSARMTVVQNTQTEDPANGCHFIPHWPQPGIIPRAKNRGSRIENLHYFGVPGNLAKEFHREDFAVRLMEKTGVKFSFQPPERWHDFSQTDLVLAVRGLNGSRYDDKPATKLYNAWIAGVPAICGTESSMVECCHHPHDAFFAKSIDNVIDFVTQIKQEPESYRRMQERALQRGGEYDVAATTERWKAFLSKIAVPAHHEWQNIPLWKRRVWLAQRRVSWLRQRVLNKFLPK